MQSISDNEFSVINFLIRNFSERFTIRGIAKELNLSAAGVHSILKKLEKSKVVVAEKLGTGLFYNINLNSSVAKHLAAILAEEELVEKISSKDKAVIEIIKKGVVIAGEGLLIDMIKRGMRY